MKTVVRCTAILAVLTWLLPQAVSAQSRPLVTEDPETVPAGTILFEAGVDVARDVDYPATGIRGDLLRIGAFGLSIGLSSIAEVQIDGALRDRVRIETFDTDAPLADLVAVEGDRTSAFEDVIVGTKIRFLSETVSRPAVALRLSTRLPAASVESGLGLGTVDFHAGLAVAKTTGSARIAVNGGLGILGDPVEGHRKRRVVLYGVSGARAVATGVELVGELNGRIGSRSEDTPVGTENRSVFRVGSRVTRGPVRLDAALAIGATTSDPAWGFTVGATWVFKAFEVQ